MKWFQHHADAHDDEILRELLHKFGTDGLAVWWTTAELVCRALKVVPDPKNSHGFRVLCRLEADPRVFTDALANKVPIDRYETILKHCAKRKRLTFKMTREAWIVTWPKLLDFKDNATRDVINSFAKSLASDLEATAGGVELLPSLKGHHPKDGDIGAGGGVGEEERDLVWERRIMMGWNKVFSAPGGRTKREHIRDWIRQGVPRRAIEEAPMMPEYQKMDFFDVGKELKRKVNGNGAGTSHGSRKDNPGAREVLRTFALKPGELEAETDRRIAEREKRETGATEGSGSSKGHGGDAGPAQEGAAHGS